MVEEQLTVTSSQKSNRTMVAWLLLFVFSSNLINLAIAQVKERWLRHDLEKGWLIILTLSILAIVIFFQKKVFIPLSEIDSLDPNAPARRWLSRINRGAEAAFYLSAALLIGVELYLVFWYWA